MAHCVPHAVLILYKHLPTYSVFFVPYVRQGIYKVAPLLLICSLSGDCFPPVRLHSFLSFSPVLHFHVSFGQSCLHVPSAVHDRAILFMGCASEDIQHARPTVALHHPFFLVTREVEEFRGGMDPHWWQMLCRNPPRVPQRGLLRKVFESLCGLLWGPAFWAVEGSGLSFTSPYHSCTLNFLI